ncbi:hypothetical protein Tco_0309550 [Tanacetum coccineum]
MVIVSPGVVRVHGGNVVRVSLTRCGIGLADVVVVARDGSLVVVFGDGIRISQEKVHLGIKVGANITVTGVPGQEGVEGSVAKKKKVDESMKANLGKLLKYNAWSTMWSPVRGSSMRKRC